MKQMMELQLFSGRWRHNQQLTTLISSRQLPKFIFSTKVRSSIQIEIVIFPTKACKALKTGAGSILNEWNLCQSKKAIVPSFVTIRKTKSWLLESSDAKRTKGKAKRKMSDKSCASHQQALKSWYL